MKDYDNKEFIGNIVKQARKRANLTQAQLAEMLEMSEKNLCNIETGKQFPLVNNFLRILEVLKLSVKEFGVLDMPEQLNDEVKEHLISKILTSSPTQNKNYLKAVEFIDSIKK